ncbi:MAG: c-type cytochrome [Parachlamydiaceae bacterium]|nr:c-type cytochrome [Parachlamydiaceae bacterium]
MEITKKRIIWFGLIIIGFIGLVFWKFKNEPLLSEEPDQLIIPLGLPQIPWPSDNPYNKKKAELGRLLYFDKRLSSDGTVSCSTCHSIPRAFADTNKISKGIRERLGTRHAPTVINSAYQSTLFWDGRAKTLEDQSVGPIGNPNEMTLANNIHDAHIQCQDRILNIKGYRQLFKEVFGNESITLEEIAKAIATFERTVLSGNSPYDKYLAGNKIAMTSQQIHGYRIFVRSGCMNCHGGPNFTDGRFTNIGIGMNNTNPDLGRYTITKDEKDWGAFKIPTLRDSANSYPYMHDGSLPTLKSVIDYYDQGGNNNKNLHPLMRPLNLTEQERKDLLSFLEALNGEGWHHFREPKKFPE